jgi:two-component system cell cycle sensor histidine kinase/response regulator CckA
MNASGLCSQSDPLRPGGARRGRIRKLSGIDMTDISAPTAPVVAIPTESARIRGLLVACAFSAMVVGAIGQILLPARGNPFVAWIDTAVVPAIVVVLLVVNRRDRPALLALTLGLLYFEAVLTASLFTIGVAFAIVVPIIGIGLVGPRVRGRGSIAAYVGAWVFATLSVIVAETGTSPNPVGTDQPILTITAFALITSGALGLMWQSGNQQVQALESAGREIAARIQAERELEQTADFLQTLVRSSPVATVALDQDGVVTLWNPAAERVLGWTEAERLGLRLPDELLAGAEGDPPGLPDRMARSLTGESVKGERGHARRKDGSEVIVQVYADARQDHLGRPAGIILQAIDVTGRMALEAQLLQAQKMEAVGQLAGGIAHDINNTLTAVGGFAQLIESAARDPEIEADAHTISEAVVRASQLTRQLLAFARRSLLQPQVIDASTFIESIEPMLERLLGADIHVVLNQIATLALVHVDPGQFEQAILNLAVNAREAMPDGGTLTITTSRREAEPGEHEAEMDSGAGDSAGSEGVAEGVGAGRIGGPVIVVTVADTGRGVAPELHDQVFEPFFTTKDQGRGSGLGLATVYGFVTQSGGEVELRSTPGTGTTIEIRLPEATEVSEPATEAAAVLPALPGGGEDDGRGATILLIEDEPAVAELARRILSSRGYRVIAASDGPSAIAAARGRVDPIELILSDVIMPGMNGPAAVEAILPLHPEAAVLFASGYTADAITEQGVLPEGVELIEKPFSPASLAARVREILEGRSRHDGPSDG